MSKESIASVLSKYIPQQAVDACVQWIVEYNIHLKITRTRASKLGDYRPSQGRFSHEITVNHDLNPYSFLITYVHEVAHLLAESQGRRRIAPHGPEWKSVFSQLLSRFDNQGVFPPDIAGALRAYIRNPSASSCSDHDLLRALRRYDKPESGVRHLEDLPPQSLFTLNASRSGQVFRKGKKIRTRFHCLEVNSQKEYFVSALAEVVSLAG